jgi:foldase protein PrsA
VVHRARGRIAVLGVIVAVAVAVVPAASGEPAPWPRVPASAVARVGDASIPSATFRHWFSIAAASDPATLGSRRAYDPPGFERCVAAMRRRARRSGRRPAPDARLQTRCERDYLGLRDQIMDFLIRERWVAQEALRRGIAIGAGELDTAFRKAKRESFPKESDFRAFLRRSRMTVADARFQVAYNTRYAKLRELAIAGAAPVTDAEVAAFYGQHADELAEPQTRDLRIVLTKTRAHAEAARAAIERGQTWTVVARKYSIDEVSKSLGGLLAGVSEGSQERALDDAVFRAPRGALRGPVKTQFGYYVFKVVKITPAVHPTLADATPVIREELTAGRQREAADRFSRDLRRRWKARTVCRAGYVMSQCANAPSRGA